MICVAVDSDSLEALSRVIRTLPCRVMMTNNADEALKWVKSSRVSLVITDEWLKDMSGARLLTGVAEHSPATARFLLAATPETRDQIAGDALTVHGVIGKPWDGTALKRTILAILKWQEERQLALDPPGRVERRRHQRPITRGDDGARPSLA